MRKIYLTALLSTFAVAGFAQVNPDGIQGDTIKGADAEIRGDRPKEYATKVPVKNIENSQVYNVVSQETIEAQQTYSMQNAMRNVPGVSIVFPATGRVGDGGTMYTSRGFVTSVSLQNGIAGTVSSNQDMSNVERIEVLKGPNATLYGSSLSSYGGAINIITKKPFDSTAGSVSYSAGSWNLNRLAIDYNTPLNDKKTFLFRINGAYNNQNTWQDYGYTRRMSVAPSFAYKVNDRLNLSMDLGFSSIEGTGAPWFYASTASTGYTNVKDLSLDYNKYYFPGDITMTTKTFNITTQANYKISDQWKSQTVFSSSNNTSVGGTTYLWFIADTAMTRENQTYEGSSNQLNIQQNFIGDLKIAGIRNRMIVGVDYYRNYKNGTYKIFSGLQDTVYTNVPNANYMAYNKSKYENAPFFYLNSYSGTMVYQRLGAYFADVINITDRLILNVGLRYDYYTNGGSYVAATGTTTGAFDRHQVSPRAGLIYQAVKDKVSVFANYQNGFNNVIGTDYYGNIFTPEKANQIEGGVKANLLQNRLTTTISTYYITVWNSVRPDPVHAFFSVQGGTQESKGLEVDVNYYATKKINFVLGYGYNDNVYIKADTLVEGRRPVSAGPAHLFNAWVNYRVTTGTLKGFGIGFGGNYASKKYMNNDEKTGVFYAPAYTVINAAVFYDRPSYRLSMNVNNIGNEKYWVGWNNFSPQNPREFVFSLAYKF